MLRKVPFVRPMVPTPARVPPAGPDWLHEPTFGGVRVQVHLENGGFTIYGRNGQDVTRRFRRLGETLSALPDVSAILDAELVARDDSGQPAFAILDQDKGKECALCLWCFDLLAIDGEKLFDVPLVDRKERLARLISLADDQGLQFCGSFDDPATLLAAAARMGFQGIISKRRNSTYRSGPTKDWRAIKAVCAAKKDRSGSLPTQRA